MISRAIIKLILILIIFQTTSCGNHGPEIEIIHLPPFTNRYFKMLWNNKLPGTPTSPLFIDDSSMIVGTDEGSLHQFSLSNGSVIREIDGLNRLTGIDWFGDCIAILSYSGYLNLLDSNFNILFEEILPGNQFNPPRNVKNYLCCFNMRGTVFIIESENLRIYSIKTGNMWGTGRTGIIPTEHFIYSISGNGLWKIDIEHKKIINFRIFEQPELLTDLWVGDTLIVIANSRGEIKLVDINNMQILGQLITGLNCPLKITIANNNLYYQSKCGEVGCYELVNYSLLWKYKLQSNSYVKPLIIGDIIFTGDEEGSLYKINRWSGSVLNIKKLTDQNIIELSRYGNYLIIIGLKGGLYVLVEA